MTTEDRKERLFEDLKDEEYRHSSVAAHITNRIAFQIRALREQRNWNQERLAKKAGMKQERISVLENPNHSSVSVETLKRLAKAFDVALMVGFVSFGDLAKWELSLSLKSLEVPSFDEDPYFKELPSAAAALVAAPDQPTLGTGGAEPINYLGIGPAKLSPFEKESSVRGLKTEFDTRTPSSLYQKYQ